MFEVRGSASSEVVDQLVKLCVEVGGSAEREDGQNAGRLIMSEPLLCPCNRILKSRGVPSISGIMEEFYCMHLEPIEYNKGMEKRRLISFEEEKLGPLFSRLDAVGENRVILKRDLKPKNIRDLFTVSLSSLFGRLTSLQYSALRDALNHGYYDIPRRVPVRKISESRGVPRSTFEEHLHKAENKVMKSVAPYLLMFGGELDENV